MKTVSVQKLLEWAFNEELPKAQRENGGGFGPAADFWSRFAELGTLVDVSVNAFGVVPDFSGEGDPHPDAVAVAKAVAGIGPVEMPEDWFPFPDWREALWPLAREAVAEWRREQGGPREILPIVISSAVLRRSPAWECDEPKAAIVLRNGRPAWFARETRRDRLTGEDVAVEVDGMNRRTGRPVNGAYRKHALNPDPRAAILDRADYAAWRSVLARLAQTLDGHLSGHRLSADLPIAEPWRLKVSGSPRDAA